jgi:pimeloyl-ACP methyl ester carboxylesterase
VKKFKLLSITVLFILISIKSFGQSINNDNMEPQITSKTIVFVHGLFLTPRNWENWKIFFEKMGYSCYTLPNPGHEGEPSELRSNIIPYLGETTYEDLIQNLVKFIDSLPEKPIIIGHSLGGLAAQKLVAMDKAVMGVCISSAAPKGIGTMKRSFWKSNFTVINPFKGNSVFMPTKKWFHYAFCNTMSREESDQLFNQYVVPESRNVPRGTLKKFAKIDFKKTHAPLLFIAGKEDHIVPHSLVEKNFKAYKDNSGIKEYKLFENRDHFICGEENGEEVASYVHKWIIKN